MKNTLLAFCLFLVLPLHAQNEAAQASNQFAFDCLAQLEKKSGNIAFSPYSAWTALTMTSAGAANSSLKEIATVLHFSPNDQTIHDSAAIWLKELNSVKGIELNTANRLWVEKSFVPLPAFMALIKRDYSGGFQSLNFTKDSQAARHSINQWVSQQTAKRIPELLRPEMIQKDTRLVITNAVYLKAKWEEPFDIQATQPKIFTTTNGKNIKTPMMSQTSSFPYFETKNYKVIQIPYAKGEASMIVWLPAKGNVRPPTAADFTNLGKGFKKELVDLSLPRFEIDLRTDFIPLLESLGLKSPFSPDDADFSHLTTSVPLFISIVTHQVFIKVSEEKTEAAAATAVATNIGCSIDESGPPLSIKQFIANRPFYFFIVHNPTNGILFAGRVEDPASYKAD